MMEKRIEAIEGEIKGIHKQLGESGKVNAVIATELRGVHVVLKELSANQREIISVKSQVDNIVNNCQRQHRVYEKNFDESFVRLRVVEQDKISKVDLETCKAGVEKTATDAIKPIATTVAKLERSKTWWETTILSSVLGGTFLYIVYHVFGKPGG